MNDDAVTLYRAAGPEEMRLVTAQGYRRWPPRLPEQPFFYPVASQEYAREIAETWDVPRQGQGFVTRFRVRKSFMDRYSIRQVGARIHLEWWIPAEDLEELNDNIVGLIEVLGEFT